MADGYRSGVIMLGARGTEAADIGPDEAGFDARRRRELIEDCAAAVVVLVGWFAIIAFWRRQGWMPQDMESWTVAGICLGVAVAGRRTLPQTVLCALCVLYPFVYFRGLASEFHLIPIMVLGYAAAQRGRRLPLVVASCALAVLLLFSPVVTASSLAPSDIWWSVYEARVDWAHEATVGFRGPWRADWSGMVVAQIATLGVVLLGAVLASQRTVAMELERRNRELERLRVVDADRAVTQERMRISRELHDVVAHHLTAIVMRAQGAHHVAAARPKEAVDAVGWIAEVGREALVATRDAVTSLRDQTAAAVDDDLTLVEHLEQIVERMAQVGMDVGMDVRWDDEPSLTPNSALALRRVVQEALTNVLKHSSVQSATVVVRQRDRELVVSVVDAGTRLEAAGRGGGTGLLGLRERMASCGGGLSYGPSPSGGWRVEAWVPVRPGASA